MNSEGRDCERSTDCVCVCAHIQHGPSSPFRIQVRPWTRIAPRLFPWSLQAASSIPSLSPQIDQTTLSGFKFCCPLLLFVAQSVDESRKSRVRMSTSPSLRTTFFLHLTSKSNTRAPVPRFAVRTSAQSRVKSLIKWSESNRLAFFLIRYEQNRLALLLAFSESHQT